MLFLLITRSMKKGRSVCVREKREEREEEKRGETESAECKEEIPQLLLVVY